MKPTKKKKAAAKPRRIDPDEQRRLAHEALKELATRHLWHFVKQAWHVIEPTEPFVDNWHIHAICDHLEAVTDGRIPKLLINVPPGTMKPVHVDELVYSKRGFVRLGDIVVGDEVLTHRGRFRSVTAVHEQGNLPIVEVSTFAGRKVKAAPDHPFLTPRGWVAAGALTSHDYVGVPRRVEEHSAQMVTEDEARLLGYLVGDGCISHRSLAFVNADKEIINDFIRCATNIGFFAKEKKHANKNVKASCVRLKSTDGRWNSWKQKEVPVHAWLKRHGLFLSNSYTKRVPPAVFASGPDIMRAFLGAYWSCDGMFSIRHSGKKTSMMGSSTTVSIGLAEDILRMLSALNIDCRLRKKTISKVSKKQPGGKYVSYELQTSRRNEVFKFSKLESLCSRKRALASSAFSDRFEPEIYADAVVSVVPVGTGECRCLTVEEDCSFTVNSLAVHNSLMTAVFWPAWVWATQPGKRFMYSSYAESLSLRDSVKTRDLVCSEWYQERWPLGLKEDQNAKGRFDTEAGGWRIVGSITGKGIGEHPDFNVGDDPHNVLQAESEADRESVSRWFEGVFSIRGEVRDCKRVLVMQRLHSLDCSGLALEKGGWTHLCFPMRYEVPAPRDPAKPVSKDNPLVPRMPTTCIGFQDPRTVDGELLWPAKYPNEKVTNLEASMGLYSAAGQLQQRPTPRGGAKFQRAWFSVKTVCPPLVEAVRYWDKAGTKGGTGARTAGVLMGKWIDTAATIPAFRERFIVLDVITLREEAGAREKVIKQTATTDRAKWGNVSVWVEQEPGSGGKESAEATVGNLAGFACYIERVTGSKEVRAEPFIAQASVGKVDLLMGEWNAGYLDELEHFPNGKLKDLVDGSSGAFNKLSVGTGAFGSAGELQAPGSRDTGGADFFDEGAKFDAGRGDDFFS